MNSRCESPFVSEAFSSEEFPAKGTEVPCSFLSVVFLGRKTRPFNSFPGQKFSLGGCVIVEPRKAQSAKQCEAVRSSAGWPANTSRRRLALDGICYSLRGTARERSDSRRQPISSSTHGKSSQHASSHNWSLTGATRCFVCCHNLARTYPILDELVKGVHDALT